MKPIIFAIVIAAATTGDASLAGVHKATVTPKGNPAQWVSHEDADGSVLQLGGGIATVAYDITPEGRVANCQVIKPAPSPKIGNFICRLVTRRGRYVVGKAGTGTYTMGWAD